MDQFSTVFHEIFEKSGAKNFYGSRGRRLKFVFTLLGGDGIDFFFKQFMCKTSFSARNAAFWKKMTLVWQRFHLCDDKALFSFAEAHGPLIRELSSVIYRVIFKTFTALKVSTVKCLKRLKQCLGHRVTGGNDPTKARPDGVFYNEKFDIKSIKKERAKVAKLWYMSMWLLLRLGPLLVAQSIPDKRLKDLPRC